MENQVVDAVSKTCRIREALPVILPIAGAVGLMLGLSYLILRKKSAKTVEPE